MRKFLTATLVACALSGLVATTSRAPQAADVAHETVFACIHEEIAREALDVAVAEGALAGFEVLERNAGLCFMDWIEYEAGTGVVIYEVGRDDRTLIIEELTSIHSGTVIYAIKVGTRGQAT